MMFKKSLDGRPARVAGAGLEVNIREERRLLRQPGRAVLLGFGLATFLAGCAIVSPLPPANLKEPGWTLHEGQAVWRLEHGNREVAGDVMVATRPDGTAFVQFSKTPFPLVIAQVSQRRWQVEFPPQNKHYAGRGNPPKRLIWLYLPRVLAGLPPPAGWTWHRDASGWLLKNGATGEAVEGFFNDNATGPTQSPESESQAPPLVRNSDF